ncbi:dermonecrotic toxin domain-containing protein [Pseudomonas kribbensis]|uniref:dermonecrotic toxin domain-containing protein n=1 Tax=Pseudomonas kribbensis TaxID=1628086 RepID=UPI003D77D71A
MACQPCNVCGETSRRYSYTTCDGSPVPSLTSRHSRAHAHFSRLEMPTPALLFPEALDSPVRWSELGRIHGLEDKDFRWLADVRLASDTLRRQQRPPMSAERILLTADNQNPVTLPGAFVLSETPYDKGQILYTPYGGIRKYHSRANLRAQLEARLRTIDDQDTLLAFLPLAQQRRLQDAERISVTFSIIEEDVFEERDTSLWQGPLLNAQAMLDELKKLPTLTQLLDSALDELLRPHFGALQQSRTRVSVYSARDTDGNSGPAGDAPRVDSMSLSEAVLMHYRHQRWPGTRQPGFSHPARTPGTHDQEQWRNAFIQASGMLPALLFRQLEHYWNAAAVLGSTRRAFLARVLEDQARVDWMRKREAGTLDANQFDTLHQLIQPTADRPSAPITETVRLWENPANYVELAGSLMISSGSEAFLYTPSQGLHQLKDYQDLKATLQSKFMADGHEDELYALLSLEERSRFLGFDQPQVSGDRVAGEVFRFLCESIITKQRQNLEYALQVFRLSDGAVNLQALFDKSVDIRSMIHEHLLQLDAQGRWSTQPVWSGSQQPSLLLADKARAATKTFHAVETPLLENLDRQPMTTRDTQRAWLESTKSDLAHAWFVGVNGEARLRASSGSLPAWARAVVETVINADRPTRMERNGLEGFRPDAYDLTLESPDGRTVWLLAHCILMTERGGLDPQHSGRIVLWTPALGLEVFENIANARQTLSRRLLDNVQSLSLLENILPEQYLPHQRYTLGRMRIIHRNVLHERMQSGIEHYLARCEQVRRRMDKGVKRDKALSALRKIMPQTNLRLASEHARAIENQQTFPAWLSMAPVMDQKRHVELLERWNRSVVDDKDYLTGVTPLVEHVELALKTSLALRFPNEHLDPRQIEIIPDLALAGPPRDLVEFALNHINVLQGTGYRVASKTTETLPPGLDRNTVDQLLLSLEIPTTYGRKITAALSTDTVEGRERKQRFFRQLPWQLMQHAHALKLQQHLSAAAYTQVCQGLDMPDGYARATVPGAHTVVSPLALVKTAGANAETALGLYVFAPGQRHVGPLVLYAPYAGQVFHEFKDEEALIAALNTPGPLQNLLLLRLPAGRQAVFRSLLAATAGQTSEMTLASRPIEGNLLEQLYNDNLKLLQQQLESQPEREAQSDWETAKTLFSQGIKQVSAALQGKLAFVPFLWRAYDDMKDSAEALQDHHWKRALQSFIAGGVQMVQMALLPEVSADAEGVEQETGEITTPDISEIEPTSPLRTLMQSFEVTDLALKDLVYGSTTGTYRQPGSNRDFAAINGKVYPVTKRDSSWQLTGAGKHSFRFQKSGLAMVQSPTHQTIHYGQAFRKLTERNTISRLRRTMLNIEAHGMDEIRLKYPDKARMLGNAIDLARRYAFYCLHNLTPLSNGTDNPRVSRFLESFFDVPNVTTAILAKISATILPICRALVDPADELLNTDRFVVGSNRIMHDVIAFVLDGDENKLVHFTEHFFDQQLGRFKNHLLEAFDVDGHAQASTLIHEFSHQYSKALDIASLRAREPFSDLISTITPAGALLFQELAFDQTTALSLNTPRAQLFAEWDTTLKTWVDINNNPDLQLISEEVLKLTGSNTMQEARNAFLDPQTPDVRIDVILRNADSIARLICEIGRQLDPVQSP